LKFGDGLFVTRPLRLEYARAIYHVMSRGGTQEAIFLDDEDRPRFLKRLGEASENAGWQIHDYYLMSCAWIGCCRESGIWQDKRIWLA
jgi:hypothetical protein